MVAKRSFLRSNGRSGVGDLFCCVLFWMARSGEFLEDFDVRSREERIPTGVEVAFSQLEVTAEEDFGLAWGSQRGRCRKPQKTYQISRGKRTRLARSGLLWVRFA